MDSDCISGSCTGTWTKIVLSRPGKLATGNDGRLRETWSTGIATVLRFGSKLDTVWRKYGVAGLYGVDVPVFCYLLICFIRAYIGVLTTTAGPAVAGLLDTCRSTIPASVATAGTINCPRHLWLCITLSLAFRCCATLACSCALFATSSLY